MKRLFSILLILLSVGFAQADPDDSTGPVFVDLTSVYAQSQASSRS